MLFLYLGHPRTGAPTRSTVNCQLKTVRPKELSLRGRLRPWQSVPQRLPCVKGKQSAVAVVNDSPVDCQSRDRARLSELARRSRDWGIVTRCFAPQENGFPRLLHSLGMTRDFHIFRNEELAMPWIDDKSSWIVARQHELNCQSCMRRSAIHVAQQQFMHWCNSCR